jgi:hypothetical protein
MLTQDSGGFFTNQTLSRQLRSPGQPITRWRQLTKKDPQFGKRSGQKLLFNRVLNLKADPKNGALLAEGQPIPRDGFVISQGECLAQASGQGIPWTEEFQVQSEFDTNDPIESRALDHEVKALDYRAADPFLTCKYKYSPTGNPTEGDQYNQGNFGFTMTFDGTAPNDATRSFRVWDFRNVADMMKNGRYRAVNTADVFARTVAPAPTWDGQSFLAVVSVEACRAIKEDPKWEEAQYYGDPEKLFTGEAGRLYGIRFIEENHVLKAIAGGGMDVHNTDVAGEAMVIAKDPAMECVVTPEEIRIDIPRDFGRDQAMAWYYLGGWARIWDGDNKTDNRIVHMTALNVIDHDPS